MSVVPAHFYKLFKQWADEGRTITEIDWTSPLKRHFKAVVYFKGEKHFAKLAMPNQADLDEKDMLEGMRREVWWSQVIQKLRESDPRFPFTSPRVIETNVNQEPFQDKVAWIIFEYIDGGPMVDWEPQRSDEELGIERLGKFGRLLPEVIKALLALDRIHPETLEKLGLPPLPSPPHGMLRYQKKRITGHAYCRAGKWCIRAQELLDDT